MQDNHHICKADSSICLQLFHSAGWFRICARRIIFKHSSQWSSASNRDRPILLWQKHMQKSNDSSCCIGYHISKYKRHIHCKTCTFGMQWWATMHRHIIKHHTATATERTVSLVWTLLLANVWRAYISYCPSTWLFTNRKTIEKQGSDWCWYMLRKS